MKYLCDPHIIPTNTCPPDFAELVRRAEAFAEYALEIQLDIADGIFAPATSWPYAPGQWSELEGAALPRADVILHEAHLMVEKPYDIGVALAKAGCRRIVPHIETFADAETARHAFAAWRAAGAAEVGLSLLIDTPLESIDPLAADCDVVQIMSIAKIGAQGQPFDERALSRVEELHARYPDLMVAVDGGITESNIEELVRAGANRLCVGSAISKSENPAAAFASLHERAMRGCTPPIAIAR